MPSLSVIICSHSPRPNYLRRTLDALRLQSLPQSEWELLLVDNASREPLAPAWDLSWHQNARHIQIPQLGLAHARQGGMKAAQSDLLVFVDDDNVLEPDYLSRVMTIGHEWPQLGAWGSGTIAPEFEVAPAPYLQDVLFFLGLRVAKAAIWSNDPNCYLAMPIGAGLCVRTKLALAYCELSAAGPLQIFGREGQSLLSGEDYDICYTACRLGQGMAVFPELKLLHLIPKERVQEDYLIRLIEGVATSSFILRYKWLGEIPKSPRTLFGLLTMAVNFILRRGIARRWYFAEKRAASKALTIIDAANQLRERSGKLVLPVSVDNTSPPTY